MACTMTPSLLTVTSGIQSVSVLHYENGTLRITCTFAEGTLSEGCLVTLTLESGPSLSIPISRSVLPPPDSIRSL